MPVFLLDEKKCLQDGICSKICPAKIIEGPVGSYPKVANTSRCIGCGHCVAFCPTQACSLTGFSQAQSHIEQSIDRKNFPDSGVVKQLLQGRRSTRAFKKNAVPKEEIEQLLDVVRYAPTAKNTQALRWVVIHDSQGLKVLGDAVVSGLSEFVAQFKDHAFAREARALARSWESGDDPFFRGAPHIICCIAPEASKNAWGPIDSAIALSYLEIMGTSMGLGFCWGGYITSQGTNQGVRDVLGIKEGEVLAGAQMFGYPALFPHSRPSRKALEIDWR